MRPRNVISRLVLACLLLLTTLGTVAGDETGQPPPRFRAKTTTGNQFNNWGCSHNHVAPRISELKKLGQLVLRQENRDTYAWGIKFTTKPSFIPSTDLTMGAIRLPSDSQLCVYQSV
jgi:hypothetical protein